MTLESSPFHQAGGTLTQVVQVRNHAFVIPAEAGIQGFHAFKTEALDSRLRGNDGSVMRPPELGSRS